MYLLHRVCAFSHDHQCEVMAILFTNENLHILNYILLLFFWVNWNRT
jgi:hypothetical protein